MRLNRGPTLPEMTIFSAKPAKVSSVRRIEIRNSATRAFFVLLLGITGCVSTNPAVTDAVYDVTDGHGKSPVKGWNRSGRDGEQVVEASPMSRTSKSGVCLVRSPAIETSTTEDRMNRRTSEGFIWKDALCDDAVSELLISDLRRRLRDLGYRIEASTPEPDASTVAAFEQFKRSEGIYGEGYLFEAIEELDLDPATYVIEAALQLLTDVDASVK